MKYWLLFLSIAFATSHLLDFKYEKEVLVLTESNFGRALHQFPYVLTLFYDNSTTTKKSLSEYVSAAKFFAKSYPGVKIAKVELPTYKSRADMYQITPESNMRLFVRNAYDPVRYDGGKTSKEIISWIIEQIDNSIPQLETVSQAEELISTKENVVLYLESISSDAYTVFQSAVSAFNDNDLAFYRTNKPSILNKFNVKDDSVILFRGFDQERNYFTGPFNHSDLTKFIGIRKYPVVMSYDRKARHRTQMEQKDAILLFKGSDLASKKAEEVFRGLAEEYRDTIGFIIIEAGENFGRTAAKGFQIDEGQYPRIGIIQASDKFKKYLLDREINEKNLRIFLNNFIEGNLRVFCKSEPIPEELYDGDIRVLVGKTYNRVVMDESRDVLVEFYSPACPFCKQFAPTYKALAEKLKDQDNILISKVDAISNDFEDIDLTGIPVLKFYPRGGKKAPVKISERSLDGILAALKKHGTFEGRIEEVIKEL